MPRKHGLFRSALQGFASGARLARRVAPYVRQGLKLYNKYRGGSSTGSQKKTRKVVGQTTFQEDYRSLYNRRRAPRRVRNRARRSFQRFTYMLDKTQGMTSSIINNFASGTTSPSTPFTGCQAVYGIGMYGTSASSSASDFNSDLYKLYIDATGSAPTTSLANFKFRFRACIMDFVVKNTGAASMYLEVYQCVARARSGTSDPAGAWSDAVNLELGAGNGVATTINVNSGYKVTPFDAPGFGSYYLIKSRKKFFISAGNSVSWQVRDAKNYVITGAQVLQSKALPGITEGCILVGYGADVNSWASNAAIGVPTAASFDTSCVKTYHFTYTTQNNDILGAGTAT